MISATTVFRVVPCGDGWVVDGPDDASLRLVNDYLAYLGDRHYAAGTRRSYAFDLLALCRWLAVEQLAVDAVDTPAVLRFLAWCNGLAAATLNRRMAAVSGLFAFRAMRDRPPVIRCPAGRRLDGPRPRSGTGCWGTWPAPQHARRCGPGNRVGCPAAWTRPR